MTPAPDPVRDSAQRQLGSLSEEECQTQLARGQIGRVVFVDGRGPAALPVNYRVLNDDIVFRTPRSRA
jgi:nitroimidazol reductase NimA-like FMN-containing flavoprotein (pyridoxamine 5'-phosphate oxidase superfamily)